MTKEEIIVSGLLELYVTGSLSQEEIHEVEQAIVDFPELNTEIEIIETTLIQLSENVKEPSEKVWSNIAGDIKDVRSLPSETSKKSNLGAIVGWAAAVICSAGFFWMVNENRTLQENLDAVTTVNNELENKVSEQEYELAESTAVLNVLRSQDYTPVILPGNKDVAPDAYATVYYNSEEKTAYIDAKGLPTPPEGKVYQAWSLTLNPLTPSSMGTLDKFKENDRKFFKIENVPNPEAFGITLEPAGGSESPTLSQLYTIGTIEP